MTSAAQDYLQSPADEFNLTCLLLAVNGREWLTQALTAVEPGDFFSPVYGWLWGAARVVHAKGDRVTKRTLLAEAVIVATGEKIPTKTRGGFPAVTAVKEALEQLSGEPVYVDQIPRNIDRVLHTARMRRLVQTLERIREHVVTAEDYPQALEVTRELMGRLEEGDSASEVSRFSDLVDRFEKTMAGGGAPGEVVPSPWADLNTVLSGGFRPGTSCVIGGRPSEGKSVIAVEVARNAAEQGLPAFVVSVEMGESEVTGRVMASGAQVEYSQITKWDMDDDTAASVAEYSDSYRDMPLWVCDRSDMTIERVGALARDVKRRHGLAVLVIDYVQLLESSDRRLPRQEQIAHTSRSVKRLAKELDCAVVVAAQLNRESTKSNRRPTKADLRESGSLEQDSDYVILIHHEHGEDGSPTGMVTLIVDKNRNGPRGDVVLRWRGHQARIGD